MAVGAWMRVSTVCGLMLWLAACGGGGGTAGSSGGGSPAGQEKSQSGDDKSSNRDNGAKGSESHDDTKSNDGEDPHESRPPDTDGPKGAPDSADGHNESDDSGQGTPGEDTAPGTGGDDSPSADVPVEDPPAANGTQGAPNENEDDAGSDGSESFPGEEEESAQPSDPVVVEDDHAGSGEASDFPVVTITQEQFSPRLIHLKQADRHLAVWNNRNSDGQWRVMGRDLNLHGGLHGPVRQLSSEAGVSAYSTPGVSHDAGQRRSMVVWSTNAGDVIAQAIDESGVPDGEAVTVADGEAVEVQPVVAFDPVGTRYVVAWIETYPRHVIYTRALNRDGAVAGLPVAVSEALSGKLDLRVSVDSESGRILLVWRDYRGQDLYSIMGRLVDGAGQPVSEELVLADAPGAQILPQVAFDPTHRTFIVSWSDSRLSGVYDVFGQVVSAADGLLIGNNVWIAAHGGADHAIEADPSRGGFVIAYPQATGRLYARFLEPDGAPSGDEFPVSTVTGIQAMPHASVDSEGRGLLLAWTDDRQGPFHVFARWFDGDGASPESLPPPPSSCGEFVNGDGACVGCEAHAGPLVDQSCPVTAPYDTHGAYVACVTAAVNALRDSGAIGGSCKLNLIAPRARSSVGR